MKGLNVIVPVPWFQIFGECESGNGDRGRNRLRYGFGHFSVCLFSERGGDDCGGRGGKVAVKSIDGVVISDSGLGGGICEFLLVSFVCSQSVGD